MNKIILITGGARSGKSSFAEELAEKLNSNYSNKQIAYIATAEITDEEFEERIKVHKERRGNEYSTYEESINISELLIEIKDKHNIFIIECLSTWLGNVYYKKSESVNKIIQAELESLNKIIFDEKMISEKKKNNSRINILLRETEKISFKDILENSYKDKFFIFVTNEVGTGIVPPDKITRKFRDDLGTINKAIANVADFVFNCVCGIPQRIK